MDFRTDKKSLNIFLVNKNGEICVHCNELRVGFVVLGENIWRKGGLEIAKALRFVPKLEDLKLAKNVHGFSGLVSKTLRFPPQLQHLVLESNNIGESGGFAVAETLSFVPNIEFLNLCKNDIGDACCIAIWWNTKLQNIFPVRPGLKIDFY